MSIGIVVALRWEAQCLQRVLKRSTGIRWQLTGMGAEAAGAGAKALLAQGARTLISFGCAAGLRVDLRGGSLLLPSQVIASDGENLVCDQPKLTSVRQRFNQCQTEVCDAPLAETHAVLASRSDKAALAAATGAASADMESAAVLRNAALQDVPAIVIRAVLDSAEQVLPGGLIDCCDAFAQPHKLKLAGWLAREPARLRDVYALGRAQRLARQRLLTAAAVLRDLPH